MIFLPLMLMLLMILLLLSLKSLPLMLMILLLYLMLVGIIPFCREKVDGERSIGRRRQEGLIMILTLLSLSLLLLELELGLLMILVERSLGRRGKFLERGVRIREGRRMGREERALREGLRRKRGQRGKEQSVLIRRHLDLLLLLREMEKLRTLVSSLGRALSLGSELELRLMDHEG